MKKIDLATNFRNNGQEEEAIKLYHELITENQNPGYCWQMIGVCYNIKKDFDNAVNAIKNAIDIFTKANDHFNLACAYRDLGLAYLGNEQTEESINWLKKSLQEFPQAVTLGKLGLAYFKSGNQAQARKYFEDAFKKESDWFMKSTILLDYAKLELAENHNDQARKLILEARELLLPHADTQKRRMEQIEELLSKTIN